MCFKEKFNLKKKLHVLTFWPNLTFCEGANYCLQWNIVGKKMFSLNLWSCIRYVEVYVK
jgi:hypothetical protein